MKLTKSLMKSGSPTQCSVSKIDGIVQPFRELTFLAGIFSGGLAFLCQTRR